MKLPGARLTDQVGNQILPSRPELKAGLVPAATLAAALHLVAAGVLIMDTASSASLTGDKPASVALTLVSSPPADASVIPESSAGQETQAAEPDTPAPAVAPALPAQPSIKASVPSVSRLASPRAVRPVRQRDAERASQSAPTTQTAQAPGANQPQTAAPAKDSAGAAAESSFEGRLLQAVQAEAQRRYPASARLMGLTGQAVVSFEYRDGSVHTASLAQSSGSPLLDRAALAAVQDASFPQPPTALAGRTLVNLVHVKFDLAGN